MNITKPGVKIPKLGKKVQPAKKPVLNKIKTVDMSPFERK